MIYNLICYIHGIVSLHLLPQIKTMSAVVVSLILLGLFCAVFRLLHLSIYAGEPKLFYKEGSHFVKSVLDLCPIFKEV